MKKATNPLALDLRAGGFKVFPIAKLFDLPSNVWYPSILIRENLLADPFAAWAANVFYILGGVQVLQWTDGAFFYVPTGIPSGLPFWITNILSWILHTAFASHVAN